MVNIEEQGILTGQKIKKYLILTCPMCKESTRYDFKEVMLNRASDNLIAPECSYCGYKYLYGLTLPLKENHLYQIVLDN